MDQSNLSIVGEILFCGNVQKELFPVCIQCHMNPQTIRGLVGGNHDPMPFCV